MNRAEFLPIPDYVMNEEVRNYVPPEEAFFITPPNGITRNLMVSDESMLTPKYLQVKSDFRDWLDETGNPLPDSFLEDDGDIVRFWFVHKESWQDLYDAMLEYEEAVNSFSIPLIEKFADD